MTRWMKDFMKNKRKVAVSLLAVVLVGVMGISLFNNQTINTYALETTVETDASTQDSWTDYKKDSTQYTGRIWTDKSVSKDDVTLEGDSALTIEKSENSDFLVSLSALSSASTLVTTTTTPLDIVLVLDVSGSMNEDMSETRITYDSYATTGWRANDVSDAFDDQEDLYYSSNGQDYVKVTVTRGSNRYTISAEGVQTVSGLRRDDSIPSPYSGHLYIRRVQQISTGEKKIDALKDAANNFIQLTSEANANMTEGEGHRISIIKFADDSFYRPITGSSWWGYEYGDEDIDHIGNDKNQNDGYNFTQVMRDFTEVKNDNVNEVKGTINSIDPAGATSADYGLQLANDVFNGTGDLAGARENSKKAVIFFTDGEPNHQSGFDGSVANDAIINANILKDGGTLIYSVGVFGDANPDDTSINFNAYMNGVSSNYPDATSYTNLGTRTPDGSYYKAASNASDLSQVFTDIFDSITTGSGGPTQVEETEGAQDTDGYITFTDTLGDYTQIDDVNAIVYGNKKFTKTAQSTESTVTKYYFEEKVEDNPIYDPTNLSNIIIEVTKGTGSAGDTIKVQIPASLIPLRYFDIDKDGNMTVNEAYPIRLFYSASLKDEVEESLLNGTADEVLKTYITNHKSEDGKQAYFYSNQFNGGSNGTTIADFEPATSNKFYYFTEPTLLYTDENCTVPARQFTSGATYYYKNEYYKLEGGKAVEYDEYVKLSGLQQSQTMTQEGQLYVRGGVRKLSRADDFVGGKTNNVTGTATNVISPSWGQGSQQSPNKVYVSLGNNGRVALNLPGTLKVSKKVDTDEGIKAPEDAGFEFTLTLKGNGSDAEYFATIKDAEGNVVEGFNGADQEHPYSIKSGSKFTLKNGQYIEVYGLPDGIEYTVVETANEDYTTNNSVSGATNTAEGKVTANETTSVAYTNKFEVNELKIDDTSTIFAAAKKLTGRDWTDDDSFTFRLGEEASQNTIQNAQEANNRKYTTVTLNGQGNNYTDEQEFNFGQLKYTKPGQYTYYVSEVVPSDRLPGMSYSNATYRVDVTVIQDEKDPSTLKVDTNATVITQLSDDEGKTTNVPVENILIENKFDATEVTSAPVAFKNYEDNGTGYALTDNMFNFTLTASNGAPMPEGATDNSIATGNEGQDVNFDLITFDSSMVGNTYTYTITENIPSEATADKNYTVNGMTYDPITYYVDIDIQAEQTAEGATVKPVYTYYTNPNNKDDSIVPNNEVVFNNEYNVTSYTMKPIQGVKKLTGRNMLDGEVYTFNLALSKVNGSTNTQNSGVTISNPTATVTGGLDGQENQFNFEDVTFTKPGTYEFTISESSGNAGGVTYDTIGKTVTVVITDLDQDGNHTGQLTLGSVSYDNKGVSESTDKAYFVNKYTSSGTLEGTKLNVQKVLSGRDWIDSDSFTFTIAGYDNVTKEAINNGTIDLDDNELTLTKNNTSGTFGNITFNKGGDYQFVITENIPTENAIPNVTYSKAEYIVKVKAVDNNNGTITIADSDVIITQSILDDGTANESGKDVGLAEAMFTNTYTPDPVTFTPVDVTKVLEGRTPGLQDGEFSFVMTVTGSTDGYRLPEPNTAENDADGKVTFGNITFTKPGYYFIRVREQKPEDASKFITYDEHSYYCLIEVTDDPTTGKLVIDQSAIREYGSKEFKNTYEEKEQTKTVSKDDQSAEGQLVSVGDELTYTINWVNTAMDEQTGQSVKAEVTVTDIIPEGTEFVSASEGYSYDETSRTLTWELGEQAPEAEGTLTLTVRVTEDAIKTNEVTNKATVNIGDNEFDTNTVTNYVPGKTVTGYDDDVKVGDTLTYEISYVNPYDEPTEIVISDTLMDGLTYVDNSADPAQGFEVDGQNLGWVFTADANEKGTVSFDAIVNENAFKVDNVTNKASIEVGNDPAIDTNTPSLETKEGSLLVSKEIQLTADQGTTIDADKEFEFTLSLSGQDDQSLSGEYQFAKSDNTTGTIKNGDKFTLKHGENLVINGLPEGTKYSITETKADGYVATNETLSGTISEAEQASANFINTYGTTEVTGVPTGFELTKVFTGHEWTDKYSFEFELEAGTNDASVTTPMPDKTTKTVSAPDQGSNDTATFNFGEITYTKVGTYNYTVSEITGDNDGITYSDNVAEITVNVTDNKDGTLAATATVKEGTGVFTNTYSATGTTSIEVTKDLKGRNNDEWIDGDAFNFTLASSQDYGTDVVMPQSTTLAINKDTADHKASFGDITFNKAGDYEFKVTEVNDSKANVTYSTEEYTVSVHVEDENGNGTFTVTPTITNGVGEEVESIVFENTYTPSSVTLTGDAAIHGTKTLIGRNSNENETFNFTLTEDDKNDKEGYTIAENGDVASVGSLTDGQAYGFNFGGITFTKRGTYTFYVSEVLPEGANESNGYTLEGVTYDNHRETVTVTVTDDYTNNTLVPTVKYDEDGVAFTNKYDAAEFDGIPTKFTLTKVFEGKTWSTEDVFEFTLTPVSNTAGVDTPMPANTTVQVNAPTEKDGKTANFDFGSISYDTVGEYHYTVSETEGTNAGIKYSKNVAEITVTVTDNKQGGLVASANVVKGTFTNIYSSELDYVGKGGIELVKNLTGYDLTKDNQFTFTLNAADEASKVKAGMQDMSEDVFNTEDTMDANGLSTSTIQLLPKMQKFTQDDVGKVYKYTVSETSEQKPGYTNDTTEYTVEISTTDDGSGTLTVSTRITGTNGTDITYKYTQSKQKAETGVAQVVFNNTYTSSTNTEGYDASVNLTGTKTLTNRPMVDGEFQFNVLSNGSVVLSGTNTADGIVTFTPINYTNDQLIRDHANGIASKEGNTYTYVYDVEEVTPGNGVSIVAGKFSVTVKVTDNGDGKLVTNVIYPETGLAFENAYGQSANAELNIHGTKKLAENGTNHPDITGKFQFTITGSDGAPMPEQTTVTNDASGNINFGKIVYTMQNVFGDDGQQTILEEEPVVDQEMPIAEEQTTEDGTVSEDVVGLTEQVETYSEKREKTFTYTITESGSLPGVTNDSAKVINVKVIDNGDGTISVTSDTQGTFTFVNTYVPDPTDETSPTDSAVTIKKVLDGRTLKADEFSFTMMDENGNGVQATNAEDGSVVFPKLTFDKEGIYTYTISETNDNKGGVNYDTTTYKAIATVTDDTSGKLKVEWKVTDAQGKEINEITFDNKYTVQPTSLTLGATKVLEGRELADKEFLFVLSDEEGNVVEEAYNDKTGKITFSDLTFDKTGTYNYTVTEKNTNAKGITYDESVYNIQVEVVDNEDGTLNMTTTTTKDGEVSSIVFKNKAEKDSVPEQPEKGDTSNTSTQTYAGLFTSLAVNAAALAGIATILKKRNANK